MALADYQSFADPPLQFPINGKIYTVPPVGIIDGLKLAGVVLGDDKALSERPASDLWKLLLGAAWDEMVADNVPAAAVARAGMTALVDFQASREAAEKVWNSELDPEALAANTAAIQSEATLQSSVKATSTPRLASTSGTSSPKARRPRT